MLKKWLHEPLLHFLLIGGALFILYGLQNDQPADDSSRIVIAESDIDRLISLWEKKWQRLPTRPELDGMIKAQVREEVLYREALAMGLDQNDAVVRRRLSQKVEFIFSDLATLVKPTDAELTDYLNTHLDQFEVPGRISFVQIYFNADQRGEQLDKDALRLLDELKKPDSTIDARAAGDSFMFGQQHTNLSKHQVARTFGAQFADQIFKLDVGSWQQPVTSGYGLHLVRIDEKTTATAPALDDVRLKVVNEWQSRQRKIMNEQFYQKLRERYQVVIEGNATKARVARINDSIKR
ncbi:MAG: hypothetical protein BMS9Abin25_0232 [Gammaproteobacteria bacterium]|nr:MAG: hypothetical protein BMS9Abin25_0232 [Gammaproteobacteria bacterium]